MILFHDLSRNTYNDEVDVLKYIKDKIQKSTPEEDIRQHYDDDHEQDRYLHLREQISGCFQSDGNEHAADAIYVYRKSIGNRCRFEWPECLKRVQQKIHASFAQSGRIHTDQCIMQVVSEIEQIWSIRNTISEMWEKDIITHDKKQTFDTLICELVADDARKDLNGFEHVMKHILNGLDDDHKISYENVISQFKDTDFRADSSESS